jgi:Uma2 family endonuclease
VSTVPTPRPEATYGDILALPEHVIGEIIGGELIVSPRPAGPHTRTSSILGGDLTGPFDRGRGGPGGWWIVDEPELHLGRHVLVPDLAGWRRERMPVFPTGPYFTLAPDWICEVVSPGSQRTDRVRKLPIYLEHDVSWAWLVDPIARTLEVYERAANRWTLAGAHGGDETVRAVPFDAVEIELEGWWVPGGEEGSADGTAEPER